MCHDTSCDAASCASPCDGYVSATVSVVCLCSPHLRSSGGSRSSTAATLGIVEAAPLACTDELDNVEQQDPTIDFAIEWAKLAAAERAALSRTIDFAAVAAAAPAAVTSGPKGQGSNGSRTTEDSAALDFTVDLAAVVAAAGAAVTPGPKGEGSSGICTTEDSAALDRTVDLAAVAAAAQAAVAPGPHGQGSMDAPVGVSSDAASCAIGEAGAPDSPLMPAVANTAVPLSLAGGQHADCQDVGQELPSCFMTNLGSNLRCESELRASYVPPCSPFQVTVVCAPHQLLSMKVFEKKHPIFQRWEVTEHPCIARLSRNPTFQLTDGLLQPLTACFFCCLFDTCAAVMLALAWRSVITLTLPRAAAEYTFRHNDTNSATAGSTAWSVRGAPIHSVMLAALQSGSAQQHTVDLQGRAVADCPQQNQAARAVNGAGIGSLLGSYLGAEMHDG